jgi:hypothetical protein
MSFIDLLHVWVNLIMFEKNGVQCDNDFTLNVDTKLPEETGSKLIYLRQKYRFKKELYWQKSETQTRAEKNIVRQKRSIDQNS